MNFASNSSQIIGISIILSTTDEPVKWKKVLKLLPCKDAISEIWFLKKLKRKRKKWTKKKWISDIFANLIKFLLKNLKEKICLERAPKTCSASQWNLHLAFKIFFFLILWANVFLDIILIFFVQISIMKTFYYYSHLSRYYNIKFLKRLIKL